MERLQKIISRAGAASRREAERMILAGRVQLNGLVVTELGVQAEAGHHKHGSEQINGQVAVRVRICSVTGAEGVQQGFFE